MQKYEIGIRTCGLNSWLYYFLSVYGGKLFNLPESIFSPLKNRDDSSICQLFLFHFLYKASLIAQGGIRWDGTWLTSL